MLTPRFSITQDDTHVIIEIEAPFAHVNETEVFMEETLFTFHSSPYYLRLHFSGSIEENHLASAKYDADKRKFVVHATKAISGEWFHNLDMLTSLLVPRGEKNVSKGIEELEDGKDESENDVESEVDWFVAQEIPAETVVPLGSNYGFANQHIGAFQRLQSEFSEIIDVHDPDDKTGSQRSSERRAAEQKDFDEDHYLADTMEEEETIGHLLLLKSSEIVGSDDLTQGQKDLMIGLKPQPMKLVGSQLKEAGLTLVDVIFAYCYDKRTTCGEGNVESGWCIAKLSSSLSWLERHSNLSETVIACARRSLCYPLYRNWNLCCMVLNDTRWMFNSGRKQLLKALLDIHHIMIESEPRYILNQLFIDSMCIWIQQVEDEVIASLSTALENINLEKQSVGLDLDELELAANMVVKEGQAPENGLAGAMHVLTLDSDDSESSDDSDESDSDSSSSGSSSSSSGSLSSSSDEDIT